MCHWSLRFHLVARTGLAVQKLINTNPGLKVDIVFDFLCESEFTTIFFFTFCDVSTLNLDDKNMFSKIKRLKNQRC